MEHVPTLCAVSTVGIAAAGFALGHPEQAQIPRPPSNKRKAPGTSHTHRSFSSPLAGNTMNPPRIRPSTPPIPSALSQPATPFKGDPTLQSRQEGQDVPGIQNVSSVAKSDASGKASTKDSAPALEDVKDSSGLAKSSWLRRISTVSSLNESTVPSLRPASSSMSFSNNSTAPMLASSITPSPTSLPPNKLVKRTTSQRALSTHQSLRSSSLPQGSTFRRPATSHQRSATLIQAALDENVRGNSFQESQDLPTLAGRSAPSESTTSHIWRPYFFRGYPKVNSGPRKRHTSGLSKTTTLNHVIKDPDAAPTLLLASEIAPRQSEDELDDTEFRPISSPRRPNSPVEFQTSTTAAQESLQAHIDKDRKPRHSFSISDMFTASSPASWMARSSSLRIKKTRSSADAGHRNFSSPVPQTPRSLKKNGRLQRRRNITDGSIFETPTPIDLDQIQHGQRDAGDSMEGVMNSPLPPVHRTSAFNINLPGGAPSYPSTPVLEPHDSPISNTRPVSAPSASPLIAPVVRPHRASVAISDPNSTLIGSDTVPSGDDSEMDFQSETAYDSLATRATASSNSGTRGPRIETIFDESPPPEVMKDKLVTLENLIPRGSFDDLASKRSSKPSLMDEDDDFPTPVRGPNDDEQVDPLSPLHDVNTSENALTSSPLLSLSTKLHGLRLYAHEKQNSPIDWDLDEDKGTWDESRQSIELDASTHTSNPSGRRLNPSHDESAASMEDGSCLGPLNDPIRSKRHSLFDWSEQQKESGDNANARPRTVHGKQGMDGRGSRTAGRRGSSALHSRSQSVPVSRDPAFSLESYKSNAKYGTWGLGNKGVKEDWNDDFDFDENDEKPSNADNAPTDSDSIGGRSMKVPQAIMERQVSVRGQFGHVQELNHLVEELKRLRAQASVLGIMDGPPSELWKEAEGIINLATLEDEDILFPPRSPSSPTSNFDAFDEDSPPMARSRKQSMKTSEQGTPVRSFDQSNSRRSSSIVRSSPNPHTPPTGRPRTESSAKAKSVLETIYHQRGGFEPALNELQKHPGTRLPFDTQSLRDLVVRAGVVTRALMEIVRKAEGVSPSPSQSPSRSKDRDPPFSQIFNPSSSVDESSSKISSPTKNKNANGYLGGSLSGNDNDLTSHMKMMTVV